MIYFVSSFDYMNKSVVFNKTLNELKFDIYKNPQHD